MKQSQFKSGIIYATAGSLWWGALGTVFFKYISHMGAIEVTLHRLIWTCVILIISTFFFKKLYIFKKILSQKNKLLILFVTSILIFLNWSTWIYAVSINKIIDASYGYFIFPILNVFFGYVFLNEKLNFKRKLSILIVILSSIYLLFNLQSFPWIGFLVAFFWSSYNLLRKKINVDTDIGLLIESLFILPFAIVAFYLISINGFNDFKIEDPPMMLLIFLAGPMTVIPLFLYVRGVELCGLGPTGMIFYITPTLQFLLGFFYYDEVFSLNKLVSFIFIWIAVIVYLKDLHENN